VQTVLYIKSEKHDNLSSFIINNFLSEKLRKETIFYILCKIYV